MSQDLLATAYPKSIDAAIEEFAAREILILDNSSCNLWMLCHRRFLYRVILNLVPAKEALELSFGSAFHAGLEVWHGWGDEKAACKAFLVEATKTESALKKFREDSQTEYGLTEYSMEFGLHLLSLYIEKHPKEKFVPIKDENGEPYVEVGFSMELHNGIVVGKMDGIVDKQEDIKPGTYILEHKTTKYTLDDKYFKQYRINNQLTTYLWPIYGLLGEVPQGIILNAIRVKDYKRDVEKKQELLFKRVIENRTPEQIVEHINEKECTFTEILLALKLGFRAFTKNAPYACDAYHRGCPYEGLCMSHKPELIQLQMNAYASREWNPYAELKDAKQVIKTMAHEKVAKVVPKESVVPPQYLNATESENVSDEYE